MNTTPSAVTVASKTSHLDKTVGASKPITTTVLAFAAGTLALGSIGCGDLIGLINPKDARSANKTVAAKQEGPKTAVEDVAKAGDLQQLHKICWGKAAGDVQTACDEQRRVALETFKREATCDNVVEVWRKYEEYLTDDFRYGEKQASKNVSVAGVKLASCGKTDFVFEKLVHRGSAKGSGEQLLFAMDAAGIDVEAKLLEYMKAHKSSLFTFEHAGHALDHLTTYLHTKRKFERCTEYFPYAKVLDDKNFGAFNWFFRKANCKGAEKLAAKRLTSDRASTRSGACMTLGQLGNKSHLRKVNILAKTDPYMKVEKKARDGRLWEVETWPVRQSCKAAAGKIQLRN